MIEYHCKIVVMCIFAKEIFLMIKCIIGLFAELNFNSLDKLFIICLCKLQCIMPSG